MPLMPAVQAAWRTPLPVSPATWNMTSVPGNCAGILGERLAKTGDVEGVIREVAHDVFGVDLDIGVDDLAPSS